MTSTQNLSRKPVTIHDVAREAGVAVSTASTALNGGYGVAPSTRETVQRTALRLGFQPNPHARNLIRGRTDMIGLFAIALDLGVVTRKLSLIQELLAEREYFAPLYALAYNRERIIVDQMALMKNLLSQRPMAILCNVNDLNKDTLEALEQYHRNGGLLVAYDKEVSLDCDSVIFDRQENSYLSAKHLVELGHQRIGFSDGGMWPNTDRLRGFRQALREGKVKERKECRYASAGISEEAGLALADEFLSHTDRPTAISISDDGIAAAFVARLGQRGVRVPHDVSVVGHDDMPVAACSAVPLTTVSQPVHGIAEAVVSLLMDRLRDGYTGPARRVTVPGKLVLRGSTAPPHR